MSLREIDTITVREVCGLSVRADQRNLAATNALSIAQAHFSDHAWFRAVHADDTSVGFMMLDDRPGEPQYFLWRFMIDGRYQGMGFGRSAMALLIAHVKTLPNANELLTSVTQADGGAQGFYEALGFELTGEREDDEVVMRLRL